MSQLIFVINDQCITIDNREEISEQLANKGHFYEIDSLPEGEGILRQAGDGSFYYESFPSVEPIQPEPVEPDPLPTETIDEKLARMEQQLQEQQMQNLILVDINLTVYEEVLTLKDQLLQLTGATENA